MWDEKAMYQSYFTPANDSFSMILVPKPNVDMFQKDILREVLEYDDELMHITSGNTTYNGTSCFIPRAL